MNREQRQVRAIAAAFAAMSVLMLLSFAFILLNPRSAAFVISGPNRPALASFLFMSTITLVHVVLTVGLWRFSRWSYYVLKGYLVVLLLAFPVGTVLGLRGLSVLRRPPVKQVFGVMPR